MSTEFKMIDTLPEPWHWDNTDLTVQLFRELPEGHVLSSKSLKSVARRQDNDDALFELENDDFKYAVVHLTWAQKRLNDKRYPRTSFYKTWKDLFLDRILIDSKDFE
jgi:hypothetical protein